MPRTGHDYGETNLVPTLGLEARSFILVWQHVRCLSADIAFRLLS